MKSKKEGWSAHWWTYVRRNLTADQFRFLVFVVDYEFKEAVKTAEIPAADTERLNDLLRTVQTRLNEIPAPANIEKLARRYRRSFDKTNPAQTVRFVKHNFDANDK